MSFRPGVGKGSLGQEPGNYRSVRIEEIIVRPGAGKCASSVKKCGSFHKGGGVRGEG